VRESTDGKHYVKVDAMVVVHECSDPIVVPLQTSTLDDGPAQHFVDEATEEQHSALCSQELVQVLERHVFPVMHRLSQKPHLILDGAGAHTCWLTKDKCKENNVVLEYLPSHSPDLSPLDCNLFGVARNQFNRMFPGDTQVWSDRASTFLNILKEANSEPHVSAWQGRLLEVKTRRGEKVH